MINVDWKDRFDKDIDFFVDERLPSADYDVGVIYRIFPIREEGMVPQEVLDYVGKKIAKCGKELNQDFFAYVWGKLGKEGKYLSVVLFSELAKKDEKFYQEIVTPYLKKAHGEILDMMIKKIVAPALRKDVGKGLDTILMLVQKEETSINKSLLSVLGSDFKKRPEFIETAFSKLSMLISEGGDETGKFFIDLLKKIAKIDEKIFSDIFCELSRTKDGHVIEVLSKAIFVKTDAVEAEVESWGTSGNAKIKKSFVRAKKK